MRIPTVAAAMAAAAFLALNAGQPLLAQWTEETLSSYAQNAPRPQGAAPVREEHTLTPSKCPANTFTYSASYPQGIDGGGPVDQAVKARAAQILAEGKSAGDEFLASGYECEGEGGSYSATSSPYRVSGTAYSVLFNWDSYTGGAHGNMGFVALNLASDGTEITMERLFRDPAAAVPKLWEAVFKGFCREHASESTAAPGFFGEQPCSGTVPPVPEVLRPTGSLDAAGHMILTSMGLSVHLGPYEAYAYAMGPQFLDISKQDLLTMGADPSIWR
ncbi:MAG: DUF4163 domain-containing protein [Deltaproteobacteria bacterium]|jgi:hypothetical protein|nr:DUF4163 domain-containing protein [Deltaproteobacteria bacterium]